ncbi:serine/threonine protein kinase [Streptomyces sp. NBC_01142]|uniref:serine/threonine-protein kinase n=1 Tax=Streptomyces sp. NBC_01142 TaxID=2975865 RepID=UPI002255667C|nr:serine/threonine-protein kinase [Streptomyces sp. NBC_01142]MCX4822457.1 serine/threonine protein kinase [Streptomyces sp. NBC_01142]
MTGGTGGADSAHSRIVDGRFELRERLGSGGMGTVWRAWDTVLHREVALKEVRSPDPALAAARPQASRTLRERVLREARALARISHPHVVTIHHIVDEGPHPWIVMELLPGATLQDRLAQGPVSPQEAAKTGRELLSALRAAHAAGIQHRDVKPANVLLRADGSAVLTDFGIAALKGSTSLTATGDLIGSPEYIAPERIRGRDNAPASDLWSLGLLLYVCVEGVSPLRRGTTLATLAAVLDDEVPPPVRSGPLAPVLSALLVRDPAARPDAAALDAMLAQVESGTAPQTPRQTPYQPPVARPERAGRAGRRISVVAAVIAVAVAVTAGAALVFDLRAPDNRAGDSTGDKAGSSGSSPTATTTPTPKPGQSQSPPLPTGNPEAGVWVAQLASVGKSSGAAARDRQEQALRNQGLSNVQYVDSSEYASLRSGYWNFYVPGFDDGAAAVSWCRTNGLSTKDECFGRFLSHRGSDSKYLCNPAPGGGTSGRCTRP